MQLKILKLIYGTLSKPPVPILVSFFFKKVTITNPAVPKANIIKKIGQNSVIKPIIGIAIK